MAWAGSAMTLPALLISVIEAFPSVGVTQTRIAVVLRTACLLDGQLKQRSFKQVMLELLASAYVQRKPEQRVRPEVNNRDVVFRIVQRKTKRPKAIALVS